MKKAASHPRSDTAASVLDVLRLGREALGVGAPLAEIAAIAPRRAAACFLTARTGEKFLLTA